VFVALVLVLPLLAEPWLAAPAGPAEPGERRPASEDAAG
jgi:hypothetical protein